MDRLQMKVFMQLYNCFMRQFRQPLNRHFFPLFLLKEVPELLRWSYRHQSTWEKLQVAYIMEPWQSSQTAQFVTHPTAFDCRKYININSKLKIKFHRLCMHLVLLKAKFWTFQQNMPLLFWVFFTGPKVILALQSLVFDSKQGMEKSLPIK